MFLGAAMTPIETVTFSASDYSISLSLLYSRGETKSNKIPYSIIAMSELSLYLTLGTLGQNHKEFIRSVNGLYLTKLI